MLRILGIIFLICMAAWSEDDPNYDYQDGFPKKFSSDIYAQASAYDLDNDGKKEIVFGTLDGRIHVVNAKGEEWNTGLWPAHMTDSVLTRVSVISDHEKKPVIVATSYDGTVTGLDVYGRNKFDTDIRGLVTSSDIATGDVDGDGIEDIVIGSSSRKVNVLDYNGNIKYTINADASITANIVVTDLDCDGENEIVFKSDSGNIFVANKNRIKAGWPKKNSDSNLGCSYDINVYDVDGDGYKDIITTTNLDKEKYWLTVMDHNGNKTMKAELPDKVFDAPEVGDIDGDGSMDFVFSMNKGQLGIMGRDGKLKKGWPKTICKHIEGSPKLVDIDGDGVLDIVFTGYNDANDQKSGFVMAIDSQGNTLQGYPKYIGQVLAPVTVADIDGDGDMEIIASGGVNDTFRQLVVFDVAARPHVEIIVLGTEFDY